MAISSKIVKHRKLVIVLWAISLLALTPALLDYSHYISYSSIGSLPSNDESQVAQSILENSGRFNSTITVLVPADPFQTALARETLQYQENLTSLGISNFSGSESPYSASAAFIDNITDGRVSEIQSLHRSVVSNETSIFQFPLAFYDKWSIFSFNGSQINEAARMSGYDSSNSYEMAFLDNVTRIYGNGTSPVTAIAEAIQNSSYLASTGPLSGLIISIASSRVTFLAFNGSYNFVETSVLQSLGIPVTENLVNVTVNGGNVGYNYTLDYGLAGIPDFVYRPYVNQNGTAFLIQIIFNVPEGSVGSGGLSPSAIATPVILKDTSNYFNGSAEVTGNGPIEYESQQLTAKYAFVFPAIFLILAIAVSITLVSWRAGLVSLIFVSIATVLGYLAIFVTGILVGSVNYIVNYTLTAVSVGVSTDYLVYISSRFREELRKGNTPDVAISLAASRGGRSVVISGATVAASLGMFSLLPGFLDWGLVLVIAITLIVLLLTTLFPAVLSIFGSSFISRMGLRAQREKGIDSMLFFRTSRFAQKWRVPVAAAIIIFGAAGGYFFFHTPTTYNFNSGLPSSIEPVKALNSIDRYFGSANLYPVIVLEKVNGTGGPQSSEALQNTTRELLSLQGVREVIGPYSNGTQFNSSVSPSYFTVDRGQYALFTVFIKYDPYSAQAIDLVEQLRSDSSLIVGGITSGVIDQKMQNEKIYGELEAFIAAVIFIVLLISFRTPIYPAISLIGVFFSISWTVAILYFLFGRFLGMSLIYLIPIILYIILMSLGNDYTVFIISRIREATEEHGFSKGISLGMSNSGKVVTSLGLILAISLGSLGLIPVGFLEELGVAFLVSLVIDTFIIRTFFFPSMISLLKVRGDNRNT